MVESSEAGALPALSKRRKAAYLATALFLLFVVIPFSAFEIYFRVKGPYLDLWVLTGRASGKSIMQMLWADDDAFSAYTARPGRFPVGVLSEKTVNEYGFISTPPLALEKKSGEIRVAFFGGSSTAGVGHTLADKDTWPWKATELIKKRFPKTTFSFLNAALGGYTSFESYGRLWSRVRFFNPDVAIVNHGWNEMYYLSPSSGPLIHWRSNRATADPNGPAKVAYFEPKWIDHIFRYSQILVRVRMRFGISKGNQEVGIAKSGKPLPRTFDRQKLSVWRTNLQLFRDTARVLGIELFVCKQPTLIVPGLAVEQRRRCHVHFHDFDFDGHVEAYKAIHQIVDEEIPGNRRIDLTRLSGKPRLFADHVHPTVAGSDEIARLVADSLTPWIKERLSRELSPLSVETLK